MKKTTKKNNDVTAMKVGVGIAAAGAVAAAGYYFYGSKSAGKHRKIAAKWAADMKRDVLKEAKRIEKAGPKEFAAIVDRVAKAYQTDHIVNVKRAADELKENWESVQREAKRTARKSVSRAKKTVGKKRAK